MIQAPKLEARAAGRGRFFRKHRRARRPIHFPGPLINRSLSASVRAVELMIILGLN